MVCPGKSLALLLFCLSTSACWQKANIAPSSAQKDIKTAKQDGQCGKGDSVTIVTKKNTTHHFQVCEVSADFIVGCPAPGNLAKREYPGARIPLADVVTIVRGRNKTPCWARGSIPLGQMKIF